MISKLGSMIHGPSEERIRNLFKSRRLARIHVTPELVISLAVGLKVEIDHNDVPDDVLIVGVHYDIDRRVFVVIIESESFDELPELQQAPLLCGPVYHTCGIGG